MSETRLYRSGSHEAQHLMRRGVRPIKEFGADLVFPAKIKKARDDAAPRHVSADFTVPAQDAAADAKDVPPYVTARHHERRYHRYMRYGSATAALSLIALIWYRDRHTNCVQQGLCYLDRWMPADNFAVIFVVATLATGLLFMVSNVYRRRANELQDAAIRKERSARTSDFPGSWKVRD